MVYEKKIVGFFVNLRAATEGDAVATTQMRNVVEKTKYLHPVDNDVEKQRRWIQRQRIREGDYFFVVENKEQEPIGMMGISEIEGNRGHIGRLLMYGNALQSYEAYLLLFKFGFGELDLCELYGDTDVNNKTAMKFSKMFGFQYETPVYDEELDREVCWGRVYRADFAEYANEIERMIYRHRRQ